MTGTKTVHPVGPHASVYARMIGPVELLPGEPHHDSSEISDTPDGLVMYCPACGRRTRRVTVYRRERPLRAAGPYTLGEPSDCAGYRLDPCGHYLTAVVWVGADTDPAEIAELPPPDDPLPPERLGRRVLRLRRRHLWSIEQMARQVPCSISMLGAIESGSRTGALGMLVKIAAALHVSLPELLTGTEYDSRQPGP